MRERLKNRYTASGRSWGSIPQMRNDYLRIFISAFDFSPQDVDALLEGTSLRPAHLSDPAILICADDHIRAFSNGLKLLNCRHLGLHYGCQFTLTDHGPLGLVIASAPTLLDAIRAIALFLPTRLNFVHLEVIEGEEALILKPKYLLPVPLKVEQFLNDTLCSAFYEIAQRLTGQAIKGVKVQIADFEPEDLQPYQTILPFDFEFGAEGSVAYVPYAVCHMPNLGADKLSFDIAMNYCQNLLGQVSMANTQSLVVNLMTMGHKSNFDADSISSALSISTRTLSRRLKDEGVSFREVRDRVQFNQAKALMQNPGVSVESIAATLNFHDSSSFRRAFVRWTGLTPAAYRQSLSPVSASKDA